MNNYYDNSKDIYYAIQKDCYFRKLNEYGYLVFTGYFKDVILDKNGCEFVKRLSYEPRALSDIANEIFDYYYTNDKNIKYEDILNDTRIFYDELVDGGFLVKGNSLEGISKNNIGFKYNYNDTKNNRIYDEKSETQDRLEESLYRNNILYSFQIELTSKCNERCVHCYIPHELKDSDIEDELYYGVLNQLKDMNTLSLTLSGGEPMSHPHFKEFLIAAKKMGFYVHILSNLTLLDDEIVNLIRENNTAAVQVSLYSMNPIHHDSITCVKGSFDKTIEGILKLIKKDIPVQISCPVMKENRNDVYDVVKWGHDHKIRVNVDYAIMAEYNHDTSNLSHRLSPDECKKVILDILKVDENYRQIIDGDNMIDYSTKNVDPNKPFCGVGLSTCCMVSNGNVYPCPGWQGMVLGNLKEQSLQDIWENSEQLNKLRKLRRKDMSKCLECENRAFCSPCLSRFANESKTGNPLEVAEHFCEVARVNKEVVSEYIKKNRKEK